MCLQTHPKTRCVQWPIYIQKQKILSGLRICQLKMQSGTDEASFNTPTGVASGIHGSEVEGTGSQGT